MTTDKAKTSADPTNIKAKNQLAVNIGDQVKTGDVLFTGGVINKVFFYRYFAFASYF